MAPMDRQLTASLEAPALDPIILSIANKVIEGNSIQSIAQEFDVPPDMVSQIVDKKEVKAYVDNVFLSKGYMSRIKRMDLINDVINAKVEEAMETQEWSKKDLLEWLKVINDMEKEVKPKTQAPTVAVQVNNNYTDLMKDLMS